MAIFSKPIFYRKDKERKKTHKKTRESDFRKTHKSMYYKDVIHCSIEVTRTSWNHSQVCTRKSGTIQIKLFIVVTLR